ncbi:MAG: S41 family peptidase [Cyclobacteriaceae bacterium]|nr:S41 family peptidase [Cyclobacteriaceae bacterium]MDW8332166.1 S41 family peptidase [Cyclobacteriaceae bacterium]
MWRKVKYALLAGIVVALLAFHAPGDNYFEIARNLDIFATLFKEVNAYYVDEVDPGKLIRKGIEGMLESLDPYTDYIAEDELEGFRITTTGQYAGIGALIGNVNNKTVITHPYKNFPAYKAGLRVGDEILAVDGQSVAGKTTSEISNMLRGPLKSEVEIRVKRYGQSENLTFKIKRERIVISNLAYAGIIAPGIGYIRLDDFTPGAGKEVAQAVADLKQQGAQRLIIDLRDNPGGMLYEAVNIVNLFIPKGKEVVSTKGKMADWNRTYTTLNHPLDTQIPLAVLINENSASAAEIVAGALQDYDRAVLIGQKTFGKGLVQTTRPLSYNAQLKVTTARYYIPSGRCIQELDYAHRNADGTVNKFADSLRREFRTSRGRIVFDGGGLKPDIETENAQDIPVLAALVNSGMLFEYASKFTNENPGLRTSAPFELSDNEYARFVSWIKERKFSYTTTIEQQIKEFREAAKSEQYFAEIERELNALSSRVEANKANDFIRFKREVKNLLEQQIAFHYNLFDGQVPVSLRSDKEVEKAKDILSDLKKYQALLSPQ